MTVEDYIMQREKDDFIVTTYTGYKTRVLFDGIGNQFEPAKVILQSIVEKVYDHGSFDEVEI